MATQHETDAFKVMQEDVAVLRRWVEDHREEHTAYTKLLASILDDHEGNHHGRTSVLKQAGGVTAIAALAVAAAEIARIFLG